MHELDEVLLHFGKKGMKWGVRKKKDAPTKKDTSDEDLVLKKGSELKRVSDNAESKLKDGRIFVAYKKKDLNAYIVAMGLFNHYNEVPTYQITLKAAEDLIAPSKKRATEEFIKLHRSDPLISKEMAKNKKLTSIVSFRSEKSYEKKYSNMTNEQLVKKGYDVFSKSLNDSKYNETAFFKSLSKKGYNSVIDQHDIKNKIADTPLIVFSGNKSLMRVGARKVSDAEIDRAMEVEKNWKN